MLLAHREHPETYRTLLTHPVWQGALAWLGTMPADIPEGEHHITGRDIYANVHSAPTIPRTQGTYEAHQNYIDIHYCLVGGEIIEWAPVATLTARTAYDAKKDYTLFELPPKASLCLMTPGVFAIFLPADAHMPKISDGANTDVKKVVIKIRYNLLIS